MRSLVVATPASPTAMDADEQIFFRRHTRLAGFNYTRHRAYFVTICTKDRACVFGDVINSEVRLSQRGLVVQRCWNDIPAHHPHVELDAFVVMPNHLHGLLLFVDDPPKATPASPRAHGPAVGSLSAVIGSFKSAVSREINRLRPGAANGLWQQNFYEHVVRNDWARDRIRDYIRCNPERWSDDLDNPEGTGRDDLNSFIGFLQIPSGPRGGDAGVATTGTDLNALEL